MPPEWAPASASPPPPTAPQVRRRRFSWIAVLIGIAVTLAAINSLNLLARLLRAPNRWSHDPMAAYLVRFEALLLRLPPELRFGFVSDQLTRPEPLHVEIRGAPYMLARYAVRPTRLVDDPNLPWVIGDFASATAAHTAAVELGRMVAVDCGNGVVLLAKRP